MAYDLQLQLALQLDNASLNNVKRQIESALTGIKVSGIDTKNFNKVNAQIDSVKSNFDKGGKKAQSFFDRVGGKGVGFAAYTIASQAILKLTGAVSQATRESIKFESELIKISQVTGRVVKGIQSESQALFDISKRYNVTISKVAELTRTLTQTGLSFREAAKGAEILAKTSLLATFENLSNTTEGLIATMQTFNLTVEQSGKVLEKINTVSKAFAVESSDIVEAIRRAGGAFSSAGGQVEELIALFTSVRSTSRESAETIATGFRTIFGRLQRPKTIEYFKRLGIQLETAEGQFIGPLKAIENISRGLEELGIRAGSIKFAEVVEQIGGIRQLSRVVPLLEQYSKTQKALDEQNKSSGSTAQDLAKAQQGLGYQIGVLKQEFTELISEIVNSASFKTIAQTFIGITKTVIALTNSLKPLLPLITAIATIKIGRGLTKLTTGAFSFKGMKEAIGLAGGGMVPGTGDRDTVPAMLTPGEFVIRKSAVKAFGANRLASINKYKNGGPIKASAPEIGITDADIKKENKLSPQAIGGLRGLIWENDFAKHHNIVLNKSGFPDVTDKRVAQEIGGKKADKLELKYKPTSRTIRDYKSGLKNAKASEAEIPMVVREFAEGGEAETITPQRKAYELLKQINALKYYTGEGSAIINSVLDEAKKEEDYDDMLPGKSVAELSSLIDKLMKKIRPPKELYKGLSQRLRGIVDSNLRIDALESLSPDDLEEIEGRRFSIGRGYVSTSSSYAAADNFADRDYGGIISIRTKQEADAIDVLKTLEENGYSPNSLQKAEKEFILPRDSEFRVDNARMNSSETVLRMDVQQLAKGGEAKEKEFGKMILRMDGNEGRSYYSPNDTRTGFVQFKKWKNNLWTVGLSKATKGYGPKLYDVAMEAVTEAGGMLTSDRSLVSKDAQNVWQYYFKNRGDVKKTPLDPTEWTGNFALIDPKLHGKKETWPPPTDPAWVLQSGYSKQPSLIKDEETVTRTKGQSGISSAAVALSYFSRFANGGSVGTDTVPALLTPGEFVINKKSAQAFGYGNLKKINKYADGGIVQNFADGDVVRPITARSIRSDRMSGGGRALGQEIVREQQILQSLIDAQSASETNFMDLSDRLKKLDDELVKGIKGNKAYRRAVDAKIKLEAKLQAAEEAYIEVTENVTDSRSRIADLIAQGQLMKEASTSGMKTGQKGSFEEFNKTAKQVELLGKASEDASKKIGSLFEKFNMSIAEMIFYQQSAANYLKNFAGIEVNDEVIQASGVKAGQFDILRQLSSKVNPENVEKFSKGLTLAGNRLADFGMKGNGILNKAAATTGDLMINFGGLVARYSAQIVKFAQGLGIVTTAMAVFELVGGFVDAIFSKDYGKAKEGFIEAGDAAQAGAMAAKEYNQRFFRGIPVIGGFISATAEVTGMINMEMDARGQLVVATAEAAATMNKASKDIDRSMSDFRDALIRGNAQEIQAALNKNKSAINTVGTTADNLVAQAQKLEADGPDVLGKTFGGIAGGLAGGAAAGAIGGSLVAGVGALPGALIGGAIGAVTGGFAAFSEAIIGHSKDISAAYQQAAAMYRMQGEKMVERIDALSGEFNLVVRNIILAGGSMEDASEKFKEQFGEDAYKDLFGTNDPMNAAKLEETVQNLSSQIDNARLSLDGMGSSIATLQSEVDDAWEAAWYNLYLGTKERKQAALDAAIAERDKRKAELDTAEANKKAAIAAQAAAKDAYILARARAIENAAMEQSIRLMRERIAAFDELDMAMLGLQLALESLISVRTGAPTRQQMLDRRGINMDAATLDMSSEQVMRSGIQSGTDRPFRQILEGLARINPILAGQLEQGRNNINFISGLQSQIENGPLLKEIVKIVTDAQQEARASGTDTAPKDTGQAITDTIIDYLDLDPETMSAPLRQALEKFGKDLAEGVSPAKALEDIRDDLTEEELKLIEKTQEAYKKVLEMENELFQAREELNGMRIEQINREYALTKQVYDAEMDYLNKRLALSEKVDDVLEELPVGPGRAAAIGARAAQRRQARMEGIGGARREAGLPADTRGREEDFFGRVGGYQSAARAGMAREGGPTEGETRALSQTFAELQEEGQLLLHTLKDQIDAEQQYLDGLIEMAKAQQEYTQTLYDAQGDLVRELVTGTEDEVGDMLQGLNAALVASQQGSFAGIPEDLKKQVFSVFDAFGDVVIPGLGVTGRDAQREITKNELMRNYGLDQVTAEQLASKAVKDRVPIDERMKQMIELQEQKIMELLEREKMLNDYMARLQNINNQLFAVKVDKFAKAVDDFAAKIDGFVMDVLNQNGQEAPEPQQPPKVDFAWPDWMNNPPQQLPMNGDAVAVFVVNGGGKDGRPAIETDTETPNDGLTPEQRFANDPEAQARAARTRQQVENTGNGGVRNPVIPGESWDEWLEWHLFGDDGAFFGIPMSKGGIVYAANGGAMDMSNIGFKPKGTDTVPAMLTPGEFVVNKDATKKNLSLLESINDGTFYAADGGLTAGSFRGRSIDDIQGSVGSARFAMLSEEIRQRIENLEEEEKASRGNLGILGGAFDWLRRTTMGDSGSVRNEVSKSQMARLRGALNSNDLERMEHVLDKPTLSAASVGFGQQARQEEAILREQNKVTKDLYMTVPKALAGAAMAGAPGAISPYLAAPLSTSGQYGLGLAATANLAVPLAVAKETVNSTLSGSKFDTASVGQDILGDIAGAGVLDVVPGLDVIPSVTARAAAPFRREISNPLLNITTDVIGDVIDVSGQAVHSVGMAKIEDAIGQQFNKGGIVYAANGGTMDMSSLGFKPKGTDTVPAMLTPGEFVINRKATQKNLPLLKSINENGATQNYSEGGPVYLQGGGQLRLLPTTYIPGIEPGMFGRGSSRGGDQVGPGYNWVTNPRGGWHGLDPNNPAYDFALAYWQDMWIRQERYNQHQREVAANINAWNSAIFRSWAGNPIIARMLGYYSGGGVVKPSYLARGGPAAPTAPGGWHGLDPNNPYYDFALAYWQDMWRRQNAYNQRAAEWNQGIAAWNSAIFRSWAGNPIIARMLGYYSGGGVVKPFSEYQNDRQRDAAIRAAQAAGRPLTWEESMYHSRREVQRNNADPKRAARTRQKQSPFTNIMDGLIRLGMGMLGGDKPKVEDAAQNRRGVPFNGRSGAASSPSMMPSGFGVYSFNPRNNQQVYNQFDASGNPYYTTAVAGNIPIGMGYGGMGMYPSNFQNQQMPIAQGMLSDLGLGPAAAGLNPAGITMSGANTLAGQAGMRTDIASFSNTGAAGRIQEQFNNQLAQIRQRRGANFGNGMAYTVTPNQQQMGAPMMPSRSSSMLMAGQFGQQNNVMNNGASGTPMSMQLQGNQEITIRLPDIQAFINQNITSMIYETIASFFRNLAGSVRTANNFDDLANSMENGMTNVQTRPVGGK